MPMTDSGVIWARADTQSSRAAAKTKGFITQIWEKKYGKTLLKKVVEYFWREFSIFLLFLQL